MCDLKSLGRKLGVLGHAIRLIPVKPFVKPRRTTQMMPKHLRSRYAGRLFLHRTAGLFIRQHTMLVNAFRAHLAGIVEKLGAASGKISVRKSRLMDDPS